MSSLQFKVLAVSALALVSQLTLPRVASADSVNGLYLSDVNSATPSVTFGGGNYQVGFTSTPGTSISSAGLAFTPADLGFPNLAGFVIPANSQVPAILINNGLVPSALGGLLPGEILLHPGNASDGSASPPISDAVIQFTAPTAGTYNIDGDFRALPDNNSTTDSVFINGIADFTAVSSLTPSVFTLNNVSLNAGETVDFDVAGILNGGNVDSESTGFSANVTATPLPKSLGAGLALLALVPLATKHRRPTSA